MLTKRNALNRALSCLFLEVPESIANDVSLKAKEALEEAAAEKEQITKRLLTVLHDQFKTFYQGFEGTFEDWLEVRGLMFKEDHFQLLVEQPAGIKAVNI